MSYLNRWRLLTGLVIFIFFIEYSPLVIPAGKFTPTLFGIPFSLWMGVLFTVLVVWLTYMGAKIYARKIEQEGD